MKRVPVMAYGIQIVSMILIDAYKEQTSKRFL